MAVLSTLIVVIISQSFGDTYISVSIFTLHTFNLRNAVCQLYLQKAGKNFKVSANTNYTYLLIYSYGSV